MTPGFVIMHNNGDLWVLETGHTSWFVERWHAEIYWSRAKSRVEDGDLWSIVPYDVDTIEDRAKFLQGIEEKRMRRMDNGKPARRKRSGK